MNQVLARPAVGLPKTDTRGPNDIRLRDDGAGSSHQKRRTQAVLITSSGMLAESRLPMLIFVFDVVVIANT